MVKVDTQTLACGRQVLVSKSNRPPVAAKNTSENINESITGLSIVSMAMVMVEFSSHCLAWPSGLVVLLSTSEH